MIGDNAVTTKAAKVVNDVTAMALTALLNAQDILCAIIEERSSSPFAFDTFIVGCILACIKASYKTKISSAPMPRIT